jgi:hypothetical protein
MCGGKKEQRCRAEERSAPHCARLLDFLTFESKSVDWKVEPVEGNCRKEAMEEVCSFQLFNTHIITR